MSAADEPILPVRDVSQVLRWPARGRRRQLRCRARLDHRAHRPERRRQDDDVRPHHRLRPRRSAAPIRLAGRRIDRHARRIAIARLGLVRTFQLTRVFAGMTVHRQHAARSARAAGRASVAADGAPASRARREARARGAREDLLDRFGLAAKAGDYAGTLSGGQRKLLEFARALMTEPTLVLLDEPMAGRQPDARPAPPRPSSRRCGASAASTFLFVEHDMDVVMSRADRVVVMAQGARHRRAARRGVRDRSACHRRLSRRQLGGSARA